MTFLNRNSLALIILLAIFADLREAPPLLAGERPSMGSTANEPPGKPAVRRQWQDEIVYVIVVQKFCNGDTANDVML
jgi:hypothetical protein